jgi:hypothetical protein
MPTLDPTTVSNGSPRLPGETPPPPPGPRACLGNCGLTVKVARLKSLDRSGGRACSVPVPRLFRATNPSKFEEFRSDAALALDFHCSRGASPETAWTAGVWRADGCGGYTSLRGASAPPPQGPQHFVREKLGLRRALPLAVLLVAAAGCPSSTPPSAAGSATFCNALTGSVVVVLTGTSTAQGLSFSILSPEGDYPALQFFASLPGTSLEAMTYDATNGTGASTRVEEAPTGGVTWQQASAANVDVGSFSLALTDAGPSVPIDGGTRWPTPQGTLTATLLPVGGLTDAGLLVTAYAPASFGAACP